jgi:hypothetical protein
LLFMPLAVHPNLCELVLIVVESGWSGVRKAWGTGSRSDGM